MKKSVSHWCSTLSAVSVSSSVTIVGSQQYLDVECEDGKECIRVEQHLS